MMRKNALLLLYLGAFFAMSEIAAELLLASLFDPLPGIVVLAARAAQVAGVLVALGSFAYLRRPLPQTPESGNEITDTLVSAHTVFRHYFADVTRHLLLAGLMALLVALYGLVLYVRVLAPLPGGAYFGVMLLLSIGVVLAAWWQPFVSMVREAERLRKHDQEPA